VQPRCDGLDGARLDGAAFAALMAPLAPFEPRPLLACAVSGGADSLALLLLACGWAGARGGTVLALTVDHGLRPEAAAEAQWVGETARRLGARHRVLTWRDPPRRGPVQEAARAARLTLLAEACREAGCLHLLLAHHRDDQAETLLLRLGRGSGLDGLAGMAPQRRLPGLRLLRPLLPVPKRRLEATLRAAGVAWIEDPANRDPRHERVRLRRLLAQSAEEGTAGSGRRGFADAAEAFAGLRRWSEARLAEALGRAAAFHPAGCATLDLELLRSLPLPLGRRVLAALLQAVGGAAYPARGEAQERLFARLCEGAPRPATLGGCRLLPRGSGLLVVREAAAAPQVAIRPGQTILWDGRFRVRLGQGGGPPADGFSLGPLGEADRRGLVPQDGVGRMPPVPGPARAALPALLYLDEVAAVPHLNLYRPGVCPAEFDCIAAPREYASRSHFTFGSGAGILP